MKITIEIDENQAGVILQALDSFSRLCAGQVSSVIHDVALRMKDNPLQHYYDELHAVSDHIGHLLTGLDRGASWGIGSRELCDEAKTSWDIKEVLRHAIAWKRFPEGGSTVDFGVPMHWNPSQSLPKVTIE